MGSGSLAAMSVYEANYRDNFTREEAIECSIKAIESGIKNDLGSGSNVDVVVIDGNGTEYLRNIRVYNQKAYNANTQYTFPSGTSSVINTYNLTVSDAMDIDS
mmetsp:Transcript_29754/g.5369  ORF Transcript_29754/g.5369 Transcript_29754/m.5369 type:complete len:103 (-) Transcript_29754:30-338(-)|eukprot:CAMPEP_0168314842 /NCGR_PEP_ID=MMETSP0210-20121227/9584_1 /TAXON_ID=40633 /ORGANISM="Condylostoma magnum, Strain COL2" /LENGTH=102 /DNA_ID=CAMNT_0008285281 /DNA_START=488 /DNA_END=799 /DNA_ORIENTATION=+